MKSPVPVISTFPDTFPPPNFSVWKQEDKGKEMGEVKKKELEPHNHMPLLVANKCKNSSASQIHMSKVNLCIQMPCRGTIDPVDFQ